MSSTIPSARDSGLSGAHIQPPDHAVAPPRVDAFSVAAVSLTKKATVTAAESPPAPPPATSRSHSTVRFVVEILFTIRAFRRRGNRILGKAGSGCVGER